MKNLFLVAILLGLTGCGDNNQSDTSQSKIGMTQLQTTELAVPIAPNYKLAASSLMMSPAISPLGGWSITNSEVMGASTLIDAVKDTRVSAALVTPNAKQVAEVLRGGVAGVALAIAVDQLLGAVDWIMDPANNQIVYKEKCSPETLSCIKGYKFSPMGWNIFYKNPNQACFDAIKHNGWLTSNITLEVYYRGDTPHINCHTRNYSNEPVYLPLETAIDKSNYDKYLPLEAVAEKVISNADTGSLDAQVATNAATQNILNDAIQAEPVVQELENNAENRCPSGITNGNGDCWVCSRESWLPIRSRVVYAKDVTNGLGGCSAGMNSSQLLTRYNAYNELGAARDAENACWSPQDQEHLIQARAAKATANDCKSYLGVLGQ
ncbi:hypothetical protein R4512_02620 [Acinetobacter baumannii]|uniref:hypothetical protein n=1 Tax=Acinetobacter baumannii TaxID=470 RepID=UPI001DD473B1|nr:hypothetical protein [Acinetobacter baumannii]EHU2484578.1 hypothetical protein [Acinetobacter baumannii]MCL8261905.1 hypothetical protein [Acinetobacter baumannii]MDN8086323.1 hypothetical protein [Acinetobacter baumannii]MDV7502020.1 hypothetical protein [Acinetobacter baumannii]MDV7527495.1 hypothetical protein [Acinetobacter baumannii]